ncbi:DUF72 domain-containing protein [Streptomyces botrytidirepellens]|uniref:DUF72 domain-containing protein n=1 Tax=Streptomyces botrytidirepellens TaxID=2486417 RepID=A0A3M8WH15_9ACTN|nr:DUF72 domain-containing protein [Streptomyces botrytidirepellens]RNG28917.1 DUF72 domain-containing protein [Streptomyces botrytidirepellens]
MGDILVGTCSWTDRALLSSGWYPPGLRDAAGRLRHYAAQFPVVEVDATYYNLPSTRNSALWAERTPDGFRFDVKAFSLLTGHPTAPNALPADLRPALPGRRHEADAGLLDEVWQRFTGALEPLRSAGRLGALLFQFPPWFAPGDPRAKAFLVQCARRTAGWPVAVEFRHPGWWSNDERPETEAALKDWGMSAAAVDMTQTLPTSIPPVTPVTSPRLAVARFHGRNGAWGTGTKEERFRHTYTTDELEEWIPRLRGMADRADEVHALFNNCCADAAVRAAESTRRLLGAPTGPG